MPAWNQLLADFLDQTDDAAKIGWLDNRKTAALQSVSELRGHRHVILYGSAFLQKPQAGAHSLQISHEDLNGLMAVIYGMDWSKGLTLILHTPGGVVNAAESFVDYLRSKFGSIEVIVPVYAMSAGTMIALASERIVMGRQSQLGPIDPQMPMGGRSVSARAVVEQFELARREILGSGEDPGNREAAHLWAPVVQSVGPSLLQDARNALAYSETMVAGWLAKYMFAGRPDAQAKGEAVARHFNDASTHKSHGRRIDAEEASAHGVVVESLEANQDLQDEVLTSYHLLTIAFEQSPTSKLFWTDTGRQWVKSWISAEQQPLMPPATPQQPSTPEQAAPSRQVRRQQERGRRAGR